MATFQVDIRPIVEVKEHPNADRLAIYFVQGISLQLVAQKGYEFGEEVIYFPLDSVLPDWVLDRIGLTGKLAGSAHNRVKTVRLRGELSQGIIASPELFKDEIAERPNTPLTEILQVEKYEPEMKITMGGRLKTLPPGVEFYDIEGCERYSHVLQFLINNRIPVVVTEKLEGANFACAVYKDGSQHVCSHRNSVVEDPDCKSQNAFWEATRSLELLERAAGLCSLEKADFVTIRGEVIGPKIQGNIYGLDKPVVRIFDLQINGRYVNYTRFLTLIRRTNRFVERYAPNEKLFVPAIYFGELGEWMGKATIQELSNGPSVFGDDILREGIVIKPMNEMTHPDIGRLILKQRSPLYLEKE